MNHKLRTFFRMALGGTAVASMALAAGFFVFCATLPRAGTVPADAMAAFPIEDRGMVILTGGGGQRISQGLALYETGIADRVLISGVNRDTTKRDLYPMGSAAVLDCCVDLGPEARSTRGNALESRQWLDQRGYRVAILVTSDFHLPRAKAELREAAPGIVVIGVPVASDFAPETGWMGRISAWKLLASEYAKYLVVVIRSLF